MELAKFDREKPFGKSFVIVKHLKVDQFEFFADFPNWIKMSISSIFVNNKLGRIREYYLYLHKDSTPAEPKPEFILFKIWVKKWKYILQKLFF